MCSLVEIHNTHCTLQNNRLFYVCQSLPEIPKEKMSEASTTKKSKPERTDKSKSERREKSKARRTASITSKNYIPLCDLEMPPGKL